MVRRPPRLAASHYGARPRFPLTLLAWRRAPEPVKVYANTYHLGPKEGERYGERAGRYAAVATALATATMVGSK